MFRYSLSLRGQALAAAVVALVASADLVAQSPGVPLDARGYQRVQIIQKAQQARMQAPVAQRSIPAPALTTAPASALAVNVNVPTPADGTVPATTYVTIRGPDGQVRRFPLARGVEVQYRRQSIVLRPGESTTIRVTPR